MSPYPVRLSVLVLAAAATWACAGGPPAGEVAADLGAGLPLADVRSEVASIDLGLPENRWHLTRGWASESWYQRRGRMFALAGSADASLEFRLAEAADVTLRLLGRGFGSWPAEASRFEILINGRSVGRFPVRNDLEWYEIQAPSQVVVPGANELTVRWPPVAGGGEPPTLGWFELRVERRAPAAAESDREGGRSREVRFRDDLRTLRLPAFVRLDYYLRVPERAELDIERLASVGGRGGALSVTLTEDGDEERTLALVPPSDGGNRIDLGDSAGRVVRLSLEAIRDSERESFSGLEIEAPVVRTLAPATPAGEEEMEEGARKRRPNVLVYVVDTLRRDHLGVYGYPRPVSPELDRFAADATVFDDAVAQSSWTRASMASVFTGLWPKSHATNGRRDVLAPEAVTLAELLREQGYETMAIVLNQNVFPVFGFEQGIDQFTKMTRGNADDATKAFLGWLDWRKETAPFFAWLHPVNPHDPYVPPPDLGERFDDLGGEPIDLSRPPAREEWSTWDDERRRRTVRHLINLYDAEIAANDRSFGDLLAGLGERGLLDETLIVFLSDHGEEFQEHGGWTHGHNLNVETLDIPLIVRFPDLGRGERVRGQAQQIDVAPTILDYLGVPAPEVMEGRSLLALVGDQGARAPTVVPAFSFVDLEGKPHLAVVEGDWKLIRRLEAPLGLLTVLFNRREDPGETRNLLPEYPIRARYLEKLLDARLRSESLMVTSEAELDEETEQALRALGYLQ